jgi:Leucine-rich repeat (LRR) protein
MELKGLKKLRLGAHATDQLLDDVARLSSLVELDLSDSSVTDAGLRKFERIDQLRTLRMRRCKLSDTTLAGLPEMLTSLDLAGAELPKNGTSHLRDLTGLEWLNLSATQIGDQELANLAAMTDLQVLVLDDTAVTSAGLIHLKDLTKLRDLYVRNAKLEEMEAEDLKKMLPNCTIFLTSMRSQSSDYVPYTPKTN